MNENQVRQVIRAHLEEGIGECRWCFAVDLERVKGNEIARYDFPDGVVIRYSCPRCGGEFQLCTQVWGEDYVKERINKLHPELRGNISDELFDEVNHRVLYPDNLGEYLD